MATSSIRIRPILQPAGAMMLYRITSVIVKLAWPAVNEMTAGDTPAISTAIGSRIHSTVSLVPMPTISAPPMTNPTRLPSTARTTFCPVLKALDRSTLSVPSTTQNECWTPVRSATSTARPSAIAPRTLLCSQTECGSTCAPARSCTDDSAPVTPPG